MKKFTHSFATLICIALASSLNAQTLIGADAEKVVPASKTVVLSTITSNPSFIILKDDANIPAYGADQWLKGALKVEGTNNLSIYQDTKDELGWGLQRYHQTYNGIPLDGTNYVIHTKDNMVVSANGEYFTNLDVNTVPSLNEQQALQKALGFMHAEIYIWQDKGAEALLKENFGTNATFYPKGELVVEPVKGDYKQPDFRLCYKFDVYAEKPLKRLYVYVDAHNGEIINTQTRIMDAYVTGTANTLYNGTQTITSDNYSAGHYRLRDGTRGGGVKTYNLNYGTNYAGAVDFTSLSQNWNLAGADKCAQDAHWGAEMTYDFYWNRYGRNSIDNAGYNLLSYVHYSSGYDNAFWDGTEMNYGDGDGVSYGYFEGLDVCGHEITHGLTANTSNLNYSYESGALNEGMSDCLGTSIEFYARPTYGNFIIGEQITIPQGTGLRNMANPKQDNQPDTYLGINWYTGAADNGGVHTNSGVLNHWFYLLSMGGSGRNDNGNNYNVVGIGVTEAAAITFRTNTVYLSPTSQYIDARTYSIQSATDLFGSCSKEVIAVENAWYAVGVGSAPTSLTLNGSYSENGNEFCTTPASVTFTNSSYGATSYLWNFGDGGTSNSASPSHQYNTPGIYTVSMIATQTGACLQKDTIKSKVLVATDVVPNVTSSGRCGPGIVTLLANAPYGGHLDWYANPTGGVPLYTGNVFVTPSISNTTVYYVDHVTGDSSQYVGALNDSIGYGNEFEYNYQYEIFTVTSTCNLISVKVNTDSAGSRTIALENMSATVLQSKTVNIPVGTSRVVLNFNNIAPGNYRLALTTGSKARLFRNDAGVEYPYNLNGVLTIDSASSGRGYYYFFYNWEVTEAGCTSARIPDTAYIWYAPTPNVTQSGDTLTCTNVGVTYQWNDNGSPIGGATSNKYVITSNFGDAYTVTITDIHGCTATSNPLIVTGLTSLARNNDYKVYPNPAKDMLTIEGKDLVKYELYNVLGQNYSGSAISQGQQTTHLSLQNVPNGIYFLKVTSASGQQHIDKIVVSK